MRICVVIPSYKVRDKIAEVINCIGQEVQGIIIIDDKCPQQTGQFVENSVDDPRVSIIYNTKNLGVGGAVIKGYWEAKRLGFDIAVKIDGDGQMDPYLINQFIKPILEGRADYTKGNRFFTPNSVKNMPLTRLLGNAGLSFLTKMSSGYWNIFDPTNGYTAINLSLIQFIQLNKVSQRYFFESDILFRLNTISAVVLDIPMVAKYEDEISNLNPLKEIIPFLFKNLRNTFKRIFYNYFLRNFHFAGLELIMGNFFCLFGIFYGAYNWLSFGFSGHFASSGTVMLSALPIILGVQLLLNFLNHDISNIPYNPISLTLDNINYDSK